MIIRDEDYNAVAQWARLFEQLAFDELKKKIDDIPNNSLDKVLFYSWLFDMDIFGKICEHKIEMAKLLANASRVQALPEDRTRIVFTLANIADRGLAEINKIAASEFGQAFKVFNKYNVGARVVGWKEVAQRLKEIWNGFYNHNRLQVDDKVKEILEFYKLLHVSNAETLNKIITTAEEVIGLTGRDTIIPLGDPSMKEVKDKVTELYDLAGRTKFEIEHIDEITDLEETILFAFHLKYVCLVKIYFVSNNLPTDDYDAAYNYLSEHFADNYSKIYISTEELARVGKPLQPIR